MEIEELIKELESVVRKTSDIHSAHINFLDLSNDDSVNIHNSLYNLMVSAMFVRNRVIECAKKARNYKE